jgi:hypothetical protein
LTIFQCRRGAKKEIMNTEIIIRGSGTRKLLARLLREFRIQARQADTAYEQGLYKGYVAGVKQTIKWATGRW